MLKGKFDQARQMSKDYLEENPDDPRMQFNYSWHLLNAGQFNAGLQSLDVGRFIGVYGMTQPILPGEMIYNPSQHELKGKIVLLATEGGFGDEIIHVRFASALAERGAKVIVCASEHLHCLFKRVVGVDQVITTYQVRDVMKLIDYWIPAFSAGWLLGFEFDTLPSQPYITPNATSVEMWNKVLTAAGKLKVGIRWEGNPKFEHQQFRRFPVESLLKLSKHKKDVQMYSLQLDNYELKLPDAVADLQHLLISWEDTAAVIANLDLVISSCTAVAHLAAAMGKPTWVIVPILPYHVWLPLNYMDGRGSPWYPSVRLFRQTKYDNWTAPFKMLHQEFAEWVEKNRLTPNGK
jgi:hypothetical protein